MSKYSLDELVVAAVFALIIGLAIGQQVGGGEPTQVQQDAIEYQERTYHHDATVAALTEEGVKVYAALQMKYTAEEGQEEIPRHVLRSAVRENMANYSATDFVMNTEKRNELEREILNDVVDQLHGEDYEGYRVHSLHLRSVSLPDEVQKAIEEKYKAMMERHRNGTE